MIDWAVSLDERLFLLINGWNGPFFDLVMWWVSKTITWLPLYVFIMFSVVQKYRQQWWLPVIFIFCAITLADQTSVHFFKNVFERLRPCHTPHIKEMVHLVNNSCGGKYGFVSSHAANTFAVSFFVFQLFSANKKWIFVFLWAILVSYSRVYLGRHYPADVFFGAVLGCVIGLGLYRVQTYIRKRYHIFGR